MDVQRRVLIDTDGWWALLAGPLEDLVRSRVVAMLSSHAGEESTVKAIVVAPGLSVAGPRYPETIDRWPWLS